MRYSLVRRAGYRLEQTLDRVLSVLVVVWGLKQRLETLVHFQTGSSSSPAPPPSNAPVGHSYPQGGNTAGQPGRSSSEYWSVIGSWHRKSKLVAARLRLPSNASRAGILHTQQGGAGLYSCVSLVRIVSVKSTSQSVKGWRRAVRQQRCQG